jgi:flagellar basal-body rod modification protein FlgD
MEVSTVTGAASAVAESAATNADARLATTLGDFLLLLTTQLKNQDPLEPMDSSEFTSQLVQFASVEQQISQNRNLEELIKINQVNRAASVVSFLGKRIEATGDTTVLANGYAEWNYSLPEVAEDVTLTITDSDGQTVFETAGEGTIGAHKFVWDGLDQSGQPLAEGQYTLTVAATDVEGEAVVATTTIVGHVTGMETVDDNLILSIGGIGVPFDKVLSVQPPLKDDKTASDPPPVTA